VLPPAGPFFCIIKLEPCLPLPCLLHYSTLVSLRNVPSVPFLPVIFPSLMTVVYIASTKSPSSQSGAPSQPVTLPQYSQSWGHLCLCHWAVTLSWLVAPSCLPTHCPAHWPSVLLCPTEWAQSGYEGTFFELRYSIEIPKKEDQPLESQRLEGTWRRGFIFKLLLPNIFQKIEKEHTAYFKESGREHR
jgi:hypothetical protein